MLVELLTEEGYAVFECATAVAALEAVEVQRAALLLLDLRLPDMTGIELLDKLRARSVTAPALVMTAQLNASHEGADGVATWIAKPFDLDELLVVVARYLRPASQFSSPTPRSTAEHFKLAERSVGAAPVASLAPMLRKVPQRIFMPTPSHRWGNRRRYRLRTNARGRRARAALPTLRENNLAVAPPPSPAAIDAEAIAALRRQASAVALGAHSLLLDAQDLHRRARLQLAQARQMYALLAARREQYLRRAERAAS